MASTMQKIWGSVEERSGIIILVPEVGPETDIPQRIVDECGLVVGDRVRVKFSSEEGKIFWPEKMRIHRAVGQRAVA